MAERLLFEQTGPTDGSMTPFSVVVGPIDGSVPGTVAVRSDRYKVVVSNVARLSQPLSDETSDGRIRFAAIEEDRPEQRYILDAKGLIAIVRLLSEAFSEQHKAVPPWLGTLETWLVNLARR